MHSRVGWDVSDHPPAQRAECTIARGKRSAALGYGEAAPSGLGLRAQREEKTLNVQLSAGGDARSRLHTQTTHSTHGLNTCPLVACGFGTTRTLARVFHQQVGMAPAKWGEKMRMDTSD